MKSIFAAACCVTVMAGMAALPAGADAPVDSSMPVLPTIKNTCVKPDPLPRVEPTKSQRKLNDEQTDAYKKCVVAYVDQQRKLSKYYADASNAAADAGEEAVKAFNEYAKTANAASGGDDDQDK